MSDTNVAPDGAGDVTPITVIPASSEQPISARDAANAIVDFRNKRDAKAREPEQPEAAPPEAAAPEESPAQADDGNPEQAPAEQTETPEPELPPIEPPRSWTKEEKEEFQSYPREAQEKIARREQDRETALRRGQNETAEQRKAIEAEREKVEQARQQYEQALPALLQTIQEAQSGEFADVKTQADIDRMATEDWPRFARYQAHLMKVANLEHQVRQVQERQANEYKSKWSEFSAKEDAKFIELAPEMADKEKATKIADASVSMLRDLGFTDQDLAKAWNGEASVSLRDHRIQLLIRDAVRFREAQKAIPKAAVAAKTVPQVQRPGVAQSRGADADLKIKNLDQQLERSGNWKDAAALLIARRGKGK